jgi:hypothetical protein
MVGDSASVGAPGAEISGFRARTAARLRGGATKTASAYDILQAL